MNPQISQTDADSRDPQTRAIIVELKATQGLTGNDEAQALNCLKATRLKRGLLFNFGRPSLEFKRFIFSR